MFTDVIGRVSGGSGSHFNDFLIIKIIAKLVGQNLSELASTAAVLSADGNNRGVFREIGCCFCIFTRRFFFSGFGIIFREQKRFDESQSFAELSGNKTD